MDTKIVAAVPVINETNAIFISGKIIGIIVPHMQDNRRTEQYLDGDKKPIPQKGIYAMETICRNNEIFTAFLERFMFNYRVDNPEVLVAQLTNEHVIIIEVLKLLNTANLFIT